MYLVLSVDREIKTPLEETWMLLVLLRTRGSGALQPLVVINRISKTNTLPPSSHMKKKNNPPEKKKFHTWQKKYFSWKKNYIIPVFRNKNSVSHKQKYTFFPDLFSLSFTHENILLKYFFLTFDKQIFSFTQFSSLELFLSLLFTHVNIFSFFWFCFSSLSFTH